MLLLDTKYVNIWWIKVTLWKYDFHTKKNLKVLLEKGMQINLWCFIYALPNGITLVLTRIDTNEVRDMVRMRVSIAVNPLGIVKIELNYTLREQLP